MDTMDIQDPNKKPYKEIKNGNHTYQVYPITGRAACHLDRRVTGIAYAFRNSAKDVADLGMKVVQVFSEMDNDKFDEILFSSIPNVVRIGNDGEQNVRISQDNIYDIFKGDLDGLYGFLVSLWEAYELTPFRKARA